MTNGSITLNNGSQSIIERLKGFKRKSEIQRQAHADIASRYSRYIIGSNIFNIFASAIIVFLALSDPKKIIGPLQLALNYMGFNFNFDYTFVENLFILALGFSGLAIFLLSLLCLICGWSEKARRHNEALRLFTDLITDIRDFIDRDMSTTEEIRGEYQIEEIKKRYLLICSTLPPIPDKDFTKSKERYHAKREWSEEIDRIQ